MPDDLNYFSDEVRFSSGSDGDPGDKKPSKHTGLKIIVSILCLGIVGGAVYQGVKFMNDTPFDIVSDEEDSFEESYATPKIDSSVEETAQQTEENISRESVSDIPSLIDIASRKDAKYLPDIVDDIMPSVVGISATFEYVNRISLWGWGGIQPEEERKEMTGTGTGIVMTDDGYIVTNAHVVFDSSDYDCGEAVTVSVLLSDETEHDAKIIAYDVETDIAVLKIDETGLKPAEFGDSDDLRVGELVIAVGNPLGFDLFGSVTSGIVSALDREISINERQMKLIQTDAAINFGNSGGPLLNSCGQVIGINSAKMSSSYGSGSIEGLGFSIPINEAKVIIDDLINNGHVTGRPQIGIVAVDVTEIYSRYLNIPMGVYVQSVQEGSPAEMAGIQIGDVIIDIEDEPVTTNEELNAVKNRYKAGDTITLTITRAGQDMDIALTLQDENENLAENALEDPENAQQN